MKSKHGDHSLTEEFSLLCWHWCLLVLIGIFHKFKSKGWGQMVCSISQARDFSLVPGNEDAFERHSPCDTI